MRILRASFLSLAVLSSFCSLASSEDDYEKALKAYNQAQYDEAFIHLKNSLKQDEDNLAAKILMGKILLINGYLSAAEAEFYESLDQGADINLVAEPLGNALLFQNKYEKVINLTEADKLVGEQKVKWLQIRASACVRLNRFECAISAYKTSLELDPTFTQSLNGLASIALFQEQYEEASRHLNNAFSINDNDATTWRLKGQLAHAQGDYDTAIDSLQHALKLQPEDPNTLRKLADIYLESNDYDSARAFVDEIIEKTPNDPLAILLSSWLESKDKEKLVSNEKLEQLNEIMSSLAPEVIAEQPVLLYISGLTAFFHGNTEQASKDFSQYLLKKPNDIQAIILLSRTYLLTQQNKQAMILLEKHEDKLLDNLDAALLLGDLYLKQNRAFKAQKLVDELIDKYPTDSRVKLFQIRLMAARGKQQEALAYLDDNFEKNSKNITFLFTYSMMKLQAEQELDALKSANAMLTIYPEEPEFLNLKAGILIRLKRYNEALTVLSQALEKDPSLFAAKFNRAAILSRMGNFVESNSIIEELLALSPKHPQSLLLKAHNMVEQQDVQNAIALYNDILVLNSDYNYARFELAKLHERIRDYDQAIYHIDRLLVDDFDNPDYLLFKASVYLQKRNILEAQKTLSVVIHFTQNSVEHLIRQSQLQQAVGENQAALASLQRAIELVPNNTQIKLDKVRLHVDIGELDTAKAMLDSLAKDNKENPNFWLVNAMYNNASGNSQQATADIIKALDIDRNFHKALVMLHNFAIFGDDKTTFVQQAEKVIAASPNNVLAKNLLAQFHFLQRNFEQASKLYNSLLEQDTVFNKAEVLNKLAIMQLEIDLKAAESYIKQAFELNDSNPDILDTYGWIMVQTNKLEEGLGLLRKAFARDSNNPEIRYHIGYALVKLDRYEEAEDELTKAVGVSRPFYNRQKARELLDSIK